MIIVSLFYFQCHGYVILGRKREVREALLVLLVLIIIYMMELWFFQVDIRFALIVKQNCYNAGLTCSVKVSLHVLANKISFFFRYCVLAMNNAVFM